jgi:HlyD family secretion protein
MPPAIVRALAFATLFALGAAVAGCRGKAASTKSGASDSSFPRRTVTALGKIEPGEGVLSVVGPPGDRVERVLVKEGQAVKAGEQLVELLSERTLSAQVQLARAKLDHAQQLLKAERAHAAAVLAEAEHAVRRAKELPEIQIAAAQAEIQVYEVLLQQAERDYDRVAQIAPAVDLDRHKQPVDRLREQLRAARAKLRLLERERDLNLVEAERKLASLKLGLEKAALAVDVETAKRNVALAEAELSRVSVLAPFDARVLQVFAQPGDAVGPRPLLTLGATDAMYVRAEVYETDLARVRLGQTATVSSPALERELTGAVDRIGRVVQKNEVFGLDPTNRTDARVVPVRIRLDQPDVAEERIGLQVDVTIDAAPEDADSNPTQPSEP